MKVLPIAPEIEPMTHILAVMHGFHIVAIWIEYKSSVVILVVMRSWAWSSIVLEGLDYSF